MNLLSKINLFFKTRSIREKILFGIAAILCVYFGLFHHYFLASLEEIQIMHSQIKTRNTQLASLKNPNTLHALQQEEKLNQKLHSLIDVLNSQSLPWNETLQQINHYALKHKISIWNVNSQDEEGNYSLSISGYALFDQALLFFDFIEQLPLLHIQTLELSNSGNFSLTLKNHKIFPNTSEHHEVTLSQVLKSLRRTLYKDKLIFDLSIPAQQASQTSETPKFRLEAILNDKAKINGKWLKLYEKLDNFTLTSITSSSITLSSQNKQLTLKLYRRKIFK